MLKNNSEITWTLTCEDNFNILKETFTLTLVLKLMDYDKEDLALCKYANKVVISVVLMQGHIIAYESRKLSSTKHNYLIYEKNLLIIVYALKVWKHYLLGKHFKIETNHASLRFQTTRSTLSCKQCCCVELLKEFSFDIQYVKGKENVVANVLSKRKWAWCKHLIMSHIHPFKPLFFNLK